MGDPEFVIFVTNATSCLATNRKIVGIRRRRETLAYLQNFPLICDPGPSDCVLEFGC